MFTGGGETQTSDWSNCQTKVPTDIAGGAFARAAVGEQAELARNWTEPKYQHIAIWRIQAFDNVAIRLS